MIIAKEIYEKLQAQAQISKDDNNQMLMDQTAQLQDKIKEIVQLKANLNGNLALGHLKRNEIDESEFYNGTCLQFDPNNLKAHYRVVQYCLARNELTEAQELAISYTSRFKAQGVEAIKPFKDILLGEIATRIR